MNFYSYQYFLSQAGTAGKIRFVITAGLLLSLAIVLVKWLQHKEATKYRDLFILLLLSLFLISLLQLNDYKQGKIHQNQSAQMVEFLDTVSTNLHIPTKQLAVNNTSLKDGMALQADKQQVYFVHFNEDFSAYSLEESFLTRQTEIIQINQ
ncbi:DUF3290 family protein [Vagococcus humatus]|uniref:DUF3290 domain-containing protein n=1 Tax=Vagococcus humatus TaxID=1889241 RepID=A0A3S0ADF9_9ENTE|nr:DUF3290 family protein [Vagococcus humatus]RST90177.1 hypothetical protein C7P63_03620 [Vagococcus humatus]